MLLSATAGGCTHDYTMLKTNGLGTQVPPGLRMWVDLGFQGIATDCPQLTVLIPQKKPRGGALLPCEKTLNRVIARVRVRVEPVIGGLKR